MTELPPPRRDPTNFPWPEWSVELLKAMQDAGKSGREIAEAIGNGLSRNAVIGKLTRMGRAPGKAMGIVQARKAYPLRRKPQYAPKPQAAPPIEFGIAEATELPPDQSDAPVSFMQLTNATCRWPIASDMPSVGGWYCGDAPVDGRPYCLRHCRRSYQAARVR
jgi:GcrA cell cycle regulator